MLPGSWTAFALVAIFLVGAWFYVAQARHPQQKQGAAFLIFVVAAGVTAAVVYSIVFWVVAGLGLVGHVSLALAAAAALAIAFLIGRALIRRPPRSAPPI
jgi:H+/Cl- antiporter ClcA